MHLNRHNTSSYQAPGISSVSVLSEASIHRRKIASLRSMFLTHSSNALGEAPKSTFDNSPTNVLSYSPQDEAVFPYDSRANIFTYSKISTLLTGGNNIRNHQLSIFNQTFPPSLKNATSLSADAYPSNLQPQWTSSHGKIVSARKMIGTNDHSPTIHQKGVMPLGQGSFTIAPSPSEPLCLYTTRPRYLRKSRQKLTNLRSHSRQRSSSGHSSGSESYNESFASGRRWKSQLRNSLRTGCRSVNDLKRNDRHQQPLSSSGSLSSSTQDKNSYSHLFCDEFRPIALTKAKNHVRHRRRTWSLNPRRRSNTTTRSCDDDENDDDDDARALDVLAIRLQQMIADGRTCEVQRILLRALTQPEMRQRALSLIDYLNGSGSLLTSSSISQCPSSPKVDASVCPTVTCTGNIRNNILQTFPSHLKLGRAVDGDFHEKEKVDKTSSGTSLVNTISPNQSVSQISNISDTVVLPSENSRKTAPHRLAMQPPEPIPPPTPKSAVMPTREVLSRIDARVLKILHENPLTTADLVSQLTAGCTSDVEIVRCIFRWVTAKNFEAVESNSSTLTSSFMEVLCNMQTGSLSRNDLFYELCRFSAIYCQYISGHSKGAGYRPGMSLKRNSVFRNTWLAVHVGGGWRFINCNWAARYAAASYNNSRTSDDGDLKCDEFYFLTDPEQHIFEHLPDDPAWQLLRSKSISLANFTTMPVLKSPFFNAGLSLKKPYSYRLVTNSGHVSINLKMPRFVGISCTLENRADGTYLKGLCLVEVLTRPQTIVRIHSVPSQPGRYYLNVHLCPDWRRDDIRELACSFQVRCCEYNCTRLVAMGRFPEVGFLGPTPAAGHLGVVLTGGDFKSGGRPYILHSSPDPLKIAFSVAARLKLCHQLKAFDRLGQQMSNCDNYALLQMDTPSYDKVNPTISVSNSSTHEIHSPNAQYHIRIPVNGFYYFTVYAAHDDEALSNKTNDHLECVYRILIDARKPTAFMGVNIVPQFPKQTYWWVGSRLLEPTRMALEVNKRHLFRLDVPSKYASVAVVVNASEWHFLKPACASSGCSRWSGKVTPVSTGELAVYASTEVVSSGACEGVPFVKLIEYNIYSATSTPTVLD